MNRRAVVMLLALGGILVLVLLFSAVQQNTDVIYATTMSSIRLTQTAANP